MNRIEFPMLLKFYCMYNNLYICYSSRMRSRSEQVQPHALFFSFVMTILNCTIRAPLCGSAGESALQFLFYQELSCTSGASPWHVVDFGSRICVRLVAKNTRLPKKGFVQPSTTRPTVAETTPTTSYLSYPISGCRIGCFII